MLWSIWFLLASCLKQAEGESTWLIHFLPSLGSCKSMSISLNVLECPQLTGCQGMLAESTGLPGDHLGQTTVGYRMPLRGLHLQGCSRERAYWRTRCVTNFVAEHWINWKNLKYFTQIIAGWWFHKIFMFTPTRGDEPIWRTFSQRGGSTTN